MKVSIVVGLAFGDEGKGKTVEYLCRQGDKPFVIRFNGGHQAGHQVWHGQHSHTFSNFGSGSFNGAPTYWSNYCTFYPIGVINELKALTDKGVEPILYIDKLCPVTTVYDIFFNRALEQVRGSKTTCGVGFGVTLERHESHYKLYAMDLPVPAVLKAKLEAIKGYYDRKVARANDPLLKELYEAMRDQNSEDDYLMAIQSCVAKFKIVDEKEAMEMIFKDYGNIIFEGAQGLLLDQDFGFFPYVTRSHTSTKNALALLKRNIVTMPPTVYYVMRAYMTRHGDGPFEIDENLTLYPAHPKDNNAYNMWQGNFKRGLVDIELIKWGLDHDSLYSKNLPKVLCINHTDVARTMQLKGKPMSMIVEGRIRQFDKVQMANLILPGATYLFGAGNTTYEALKIEEKVLT